MRRFKFAVLDRHPMPFLTIPNQDAKCETRIMDRADCNASVDDEGVMKLELRSLMLVFTSIGHVGQTSRRNGKRNRGLRLPVFFWTKCFPPSTLVR